MKTELTTEQSQHLIDIGVPKNKVSKVFLFNNNKPIFTLTDLLEILPKDILYTRAQDEYSSYYSIIIQSGGDLGEWEVNYWCLDIPLTDFNTADELIDALYQLVIRCIENGHLKFD